jgi:hypothetical protein
MSIGRETCHLIRLLNDWAVVIGTSSGSYRTIGSYFLVMTMSMQKLKIDISVRSSEGDWDIVINLDAISIFEIETALYTLSCCLLSK